MPKLRHGRLNAAFCASSSAFEHSRMADWWLHHFPALYPRTFPALCLFGFLLLEGGETGGADNGPAIIETTFRSCGSTSSRHPSNTPFWIASSHSHITLWLIYSMSGMRSIA